jgi:hypothetical protein
MEVAPLSATVNRETSHLARALRIAVKSGLLTVVQPFPNRLEESAPHRASSSTPSTWPCVSTLKMTRTKSGQSQNRQR